MLFINGNLYGKSILLKSLKEINTILMAKKYYNLMRKKVNILNIVKLMRKNSKE